MTRLCILKIFYFNNFSSWPINCSGTSLYFKNSTAYHLQTIVFLFLAEFLPEKKIFIAKVWWTSEERNKSINNFILYIIQASLVKLKKISKNFVYLISYRNSKISFIYFISRYTTLIDSYYSLYHKQMSKNIQKK